MLAMMPAAHGAVGMAPVPVGRLLSVVRHVYVSVPVPVRSLAERALGLPTSMRKPGLEGRDGAPVVRVGVVDGDAAGAGLEARVGDLRDAVVAAVARVEEERGRPVVGEVLGEGAGGAGGLRGDVGEVEGVVQAVAAVELVQVAGGCLAGEDEAGGHGLAGGLSLSVRMEQSLDLVTHGSNTPYASWEHPKRSLPALA